MFDAELVDHGLRKASAVEGAPEDLVELCVEAADAELLEVHLLLENLFLIGPVRLDVQLLFAFGDANDVNTIEGLKDSVAQSGLDIDRRYLFDGADEDDFLIEDRKGELLSLVDHIILEDLEYFILDQILFNFEGTFIVNLDLLSGAAELVLDFDFYFTQWICIHEVCNLERYFVNLADTQHLSME